MTPIGSSTITDYADDFSLVYDQSANWVLATTYPQYFDGDTSRFSRTSNTSTQYLVWNFTGLTNFNARLYHRVEDSLSSLVAISTSSDGVNWTSLSYASTSPVDTGGQWRRVQVTPSQTLPIGTNYLKIEFMNGTWAWTPALSQIEITYSG
ncbi:MAG: hypothetical protein RLP44_21565 [Aggregatilineales bacterium]